MNKLYLSCEIERTRDGGTVTSGDLLGMIDKVNGKYCLIKSVSICLWHEYKGKEYKEYIIVPSGYRWDGASIPWLFTGLIGKKLAPEFALASMVHDFLYEMLYPKTTADAVFFELLRETRFKDIPPWKEKCMFAAVTLFGGKDYPISAKRKSWRDNRCKIVKSSV